MSHKDFHGKPFDESTIAKLEIFEDYAQEWIPTFVMRGSPTICIFDFFAGVGYDKNGVPGSPIRILEKIKEQIDNIHQNNVKIRLYLNEFQPKIKKQKKFELLIKSCSEYLEKNQDLKSSIEVIYNNESFEELFPKLISVIRQYPALVYLDQSGIKFLSNTYLLELEKAPQTDFLFFVSTSYIWRFGNSPEFQEHLAIDIDAAKKNPYKLVHRSIIEQLRKNLPDNTKLKLYPFSLKKGTNIFGIIFGAKHPLAVDKFLNIAWKKSSMNGAANFDINDDVAKLQYEMFGQSKKTKFEEFQENVRIKVLANEIRNNFEALQFVHEEGHIGRHAADCLKEMKIRGEITFDGNSPRVTYDNVYKDKKMLEYIILKNETK